MLLRQKKCRLVRYRKYCCNYKFLSQEDIEISVMFQSILTGDERSHAIWQPGTSCAQGNYEHDDVICLLKIQWMLLKIVLLINKISFSICLIIIFNL